MEGCQACAYASLGGDGVKCALNPHDFGTKKQQDIVGWLCKEFALGESAWDTPGCPGFIRCFGLPEKASCLQE